MCYRLRRLWCHSPQLASFSVSPASFEMIFFSSFFVLSFLIVSTLVWRSSSPELRARHRVASFSINYTSYIFKKIKCIFSCCCCCWCCSAADGGFIIFYSAFRRIRQNKARQQKQLNRFWKRQQQQITCGLLFFFCCIEFLSLCRNLHLRKGFYYSVEMKSLETGAHWCGWSISYLSINADRGGGICIITQNWQTCRLASVW